MVVVQRALAQRREMAAVLLGWTGGKLKHVRRHEQPWHDLGYDTISAAQSIDDTFLHPVFTNLRQTAAATLRAIQDAGTPTIVPHLFSNGGVILWLEVLATARRDGVALRVDGVVLDSAPSAPGVVRPAAAAVVIAHAGLGPLGTALALAKHAPYALAAEAYGAVAGAPRPLDGLGRFATVPETRCPPELYLFSEGDTLVPPADIRAHAGRRADAGVDVDLVEFDASPHVGHYRRHPSAYAAAIRRFVGRLDSTSTARRTAD